MSSLDPKIVAEVEAKARSIYEETLDPIGKRFEFESSPPASETSGLPMVLLLGNHSAGKSSFINELAGEDVQRTGIAPVDDGFTIITYADEAEDRDGTAVVTNPDLHWGDLERFGTKLTSHLVLRMRPYEKLKGVALVDSPGMIDAANSTVKRAYDFPAVVRWFAERADVILLLFDPDKPGTTGETLKVLTESLVGLDHKLLVIFNKVDRFGNIRDFARAYGALCWNLSKAIPRKDLPHIYNTYLPVEGHQNSGLPLEDFEKSRDEVFAEVERAPQRRLDNVISRLYQHAKRLKIHATVLDQLTGERFWRLAKSAGLGLLVLFLGGLVTWATQKWGGEEWVKYSLIAVAVTLVCEGIVYGFYYWDRRVHDKNLSLDALFERAYSRELTLGDEAHDLRALWSSVRDRANRALTAKGSFSRLRRGDVRRLDKVIDKQVQELRAMANRDAKAEKPEKAEAKAE